MAPEIVWKPVADFPGYRVSSRGEVQSCWRRTKGVVGGWMMGAAWKPIKQRKRRQRWSVNLKRCDGKTHTHAVHVLVLTAFAGPRPFTSAQARHLDGNCDNNCSDNLAWGTPRQNQLDRRLHGTAPVGVQHGRAILSDEDVRELRRLWERQKGMSAAEKRRLGLTSTRLARRFGLSGHNIFDVVSGRTWKHVS